MKTITSWKNDHHFQSVQDEQVVQLDGNRVEGFNPKALLLSALAACSGIDVVDILHKMKIKLSQLDITVETEQTDTHPRVFKDIYIVYRVKADATADKVKKAIDLSLDKYCGVAAMLKKNSPIEYKLEMI